MKENERMNFYRLSSLMANFNMKSLSIHYRPLRTDYDPYNTCTRGEVFTINNYEATFDL